MSDQPYKPINNGKPSTPPQFHIGDDGVIHFDNSNRSTPSISVTDEPPKRKSRKGCIITLIIFGVLALIAAVGFIVGVIIYVNEQDNYNYYDPYDQPYEYYDNGFSGDDYSGDDYSGDEYYGGDDDYDEYYY